MLQSKKKEKSVEKNVTWRDKCLNACVGKRVPLTIFLINGVKLQGIATHFDDVGVILKRDQQVQFVFYGAISTLMPSTPLEIPGD